MPRSSRGKRVVDPIPGSFGVVDRASPGHPEPFFDRSRSVRVAPWRKPDGKVGRSRRSVASNVGCTPGTHLAGRLVQT